MTDDVDLPDRRTLAREALWDHAKASRAEGWSAAEWEDEATQSEAGQVAGRQVIDAIVAMVWRVGR